LVLIELVASTSSWLSLAAIATGRKLQKRCEPYLKGEANAEPGDAVILRFARQHPAGSAESNWLKRYQQRRGGILRINVGTQAEMAGEESGAERGVGLLQRIRAGQFPMQVEK
jgi:hypothetical protein